MGCNRAHWRVTDRSDRQDTLLENTTYELGPLLAEIRDEFRGMRAIRASLKAARRADRRAARATPSSATWPGT